MVKPGKENLKMNIHMSKHDEALVKAVSKACDKLLKPKTTYEVSVELSRSGKRCLVIRNALVLSAELAKIEEKVGDLEQYELNKWFKVKI